MSVETQKLNNSISRGAAVEGLAMASHSSAEKLQRSLSPGREKALSSDLPSKDGPTHSRRRSASREAPEAEEKGGGGGGLKSKLAAAGGAKSGGLGT